MEILKKKLTRREFIKFGIAGLAGLGLSWYVLNSVRFPSRILQGQGPEKLWKWSKEAYHYLKLGENVQCRLCPNQCILSPGDRGFCRVRVNFQGKLYTLVYGNPCAVHVDPIEKKPLFHFLPGSRAFSIATAGCNFRCLNCQNWEISQSKPEDTRNIEMFPEDVVAAASRYDCESIAYTYSEPTVFYEYMLDTSKLAKEKGIRNIWITNGYMNEKPLLQLCKYLDAANVDLKSFREEIYNTLNSGRLQPVLNTLKTLKLQKIWFEITNLVIPGYTDDLDMIREMCKWIYRNLGGNYPLHFSRFHPHYKLKSLPPTPVEVLEKARKIAMEEGVRFVYIGNVPGHPAESTYCPGCGKVLIRRIGYVIKEMNAEGGVCRFCGEEIPGVWE